MRREEGNRGGSEVAVAADVVVVGAGVSGCACAATLAGRGMRVVLLSGALDSVGRPEFGPVMSAEGGLREIGEVVGRLPGSLGRAWSSATVVPAGAGFAIVDRRMVSVETKRRLEEMDGMQLRQGVADDIVERRIEGSRGGREKVSVVVRTVFGEAVEAAAGVVAVGLSLGQQVGDQFGGGKGSREGQRPGRGAKADGVRAGGVKDALERLGAEFMEVSAVVGPSVSAEAGQAEEAGEKDEATLEGGERAVESGRVVRVPVGRVRSWTGAGGDDERGGCIRELEEAGAESEWPGDWPKSPHWTEKLWRKEAVVRRDCEGAVRPWMSPDGVATEEWYVGAEPVLDLRWCAGGDDGGEAADLGCVTRIQRVVRGVAVRNVDEAGRMVAEGAERDRVWVTGRAGGARSYVESLAAGVRTGMSVAEALGFRG